MNAMTDIHADDLLFDYLRRVPFQGDGEKAKTAYLEGGRHCAERFAALCREHEAGKSVLEFASGYGRVSRHLTELMPDKDFTCCDIHPAAAEFIRKLVGLPAHLSTQDPADWRSPAAYDVVFALSFFSHMPDHSFGPWLIALSGSVAPGGLLIFTTHGNETARLDPNHPPFDERGFSWATYSDQGDLDSQTYGTSIVRFGYVYRILKTLPLRLVRYQEAFWWGHQDLYLARRI